MDPVNSYDENVVSDSRYDNRDQHSPDEARGSRGDEERGIDVDAPQESEISQRMLRKSRQSYLDSTDYLETSVLPTWTDSVRHFRGEHRSNSKYGSKAYKSRSKIFRPKTRASIKNHEAAFAAAMFTNNDLIDMKSQDQDDPVREAAARVIKRLVQNRMETSLNWLQTSLGAWQDTHVYGVCISRQEWEYEEWEDVQYDLAYDEYDDLITDENGTPMGTERRIRKIIKDKPEIVLIAPENFRFNVGCDWRDPVGTSDFNIELIPMLAGDVLDQMDKIDPKSGEPVWTPYTLSQVLAAGQYSGASDGEAVRQARSGKARTEADTAHNGNESSVVWVHMNVIRERGQDYVFWTLGDSLMLTEPLPIEELYPLGRPHKMGTSNVEAHRAYPASSAEQGSSLQESINDITNQRHDNVKLALNKRYFIKRQSQGGIDLQALMRNTPGGGVMLDNVDDVKVVETNDVTSSSYSEQDRLSVEMDELLGNFSQGSVLNNRKLNETVGGMNIMSSGANAIQELSIRVFIETWVLPVVRDITKLVQMYETDEAIMSVAANQAGLLKEYRETVMTDEMLRQDLLISVNVGMGHTNPSQKVEKMSLALNTVMGLPQMAARINEEEIAKEVFSYVGFADGARFIKPEEELPEQQPDPMVELKREELAFEREKLEFEREKFQAGLESRAEIAMAQLEVKQDTAIAQMAADEAKDERKNQTVRDMAAARENNKSREIVNKQDTNNSSF